MTVGVTSPAREAALALVREQIVIGGVQRSADGGARFDVVDPATGAVVASVADAGPADGAAAVDAATAAHALWRTSTPDERAALLGRIRAGLLDREEEVAALITLEMGKALSESLGEVRYAASYLRWFEQEALRLDGSTRTAPGGGAFHLTVRQGVGPALLISPWNFPLAMLARKVAPALAAGCSAIVKPAEDTPLTALYFQELVEAAGAPPGLVNTLPTSRPGELVGPVLTDPRVRKLSFTGSTRVGRLLLSQAAGTVARTSMELGGNAPFIVFPDADLDAAVEAAVVAKLRNIGQSCVAANRFLVHADVVAPFTEALVARFEAQRLGNGFDPATDLGPIVNERQRARLDSLVRDAVADGARVVGRSAVPDGPGTYYPATVLAGVSPTSAVSRQEIFGPVAAIQEFTSTGEAISRANDTEFGLVSFAMTSDLGRVQRLVRDLDTGMLGVNRGVVSDATAPFGGVKQSGLGREGGDEGIAEYLETKYVAL